jgi:hypothetical protein
MREWNKKIKTIIVSLFAIAIAGYVVYELHSLVRGPVITIDSPQSGSVYNSPLIEITGKTSNISYFSLNNKKIFTDRLGNFNEELLLSPGYNIITLEARDRFGKVVTKKLELILKEY